MKQILLFATCLITGLYIQAQELPAIHTSLVGNINDEDELLRITYNNSGYSIDKDTYPSIKDLKKSICQIIQTKNISEENIPMKFVSLYMDKNTKIPVFDSIRNELQSLYFLSLFHKTKGSSQSGITIRLTEPSEEKIKELSSNGYYPELFDWYKCYQKTDEKIGYEEEMIEVTRPSIEPLDILYRLRTNRILNIENNKDLYIIKIENNTLSVNNIKSDISQTIHKIIANQNYCFVIDMEENNTYEDYIKCLELIILEVKAIREQYIVEQIKKNKESDRDFYEIQSLGNYPLTIFTYLPSDKKYNEIKNNR